VLYLALSSSSFFRSLKFRVNPIKLIQNAKQPCYYFLLTHRKKFRTQFQPFYWKFNRRSGITPGKSVHCITASLKLCFLVIVFFNTSKCVIITGKIGYKLLLVILALAFRIQLGFERVPSNRRVSTLTKVLPPRYSLYSLYVSKYLCIFFDC